MFKTVIPLISIKMDRYLIQWSDFFGWKQKALSKHLENGLKNIPLNERFDGLPFHQLLLELVPSWHQKGTRLNALDWPKNQINDLDEIKKVPGYQKKDTRLLHKKAVYLIKILFLTSIPISLAELMSFMNYKNRKRFRDNYLKALIKEGLIEQTIKDKPSDPNQKYVITKTGKLFLGGFEF